MWACPGTVGAAGPGGARTSQLCSPTAPFGHPCAGRTPAAACASSQLAGRPLPHDRPASGPRSTPHGATGARPREGQARGVGGIRKK